MKTLNWNEKKYSYTSFNTHKYKPKSNIEKLRAEKRNFLKEFSTKYGYNGKIDQIREEEYPQLRSAIYLDHTGATTFAKSAVTNFNNDILDNLYGNPHSNSASSQASSMRIEGVRKRILKHFNANEKEYNVIFTQNATAAIKMAGEMFPWTEKSTYKHLRESHNSINGLRRFLESINPENIQGVTENDVKEMINNPVDDDQCRYDDKFENFDKFDDDDDDDITYNLFAYPAQCNYSGMRFPLNWVSKIKKLNTNNSRTLVLLDAAAYVPSSPLSLANKETSPDFVCLSFYKMFGFPTGLGALILKTELNPILRKGYFGGGTINSVVYNKTWQEFSKDIPTRYEDGTVNFLNIIALDHAFDAFERIYGNIKNVSNHVTSLNTFLSRNMRSFRHWNGQSVCMINSDRDYSDSKKQGGIFSFNVKRSDGSLVGYLDMEKLASSYGIHIRSGGNCNPGSISRWNNIQASEIIKNYSEGKYCSDDRDIYKGKLYGAARVSIGAMTTIEDVLIWLDFFKRYYVEIMPGKTIHDLSASKISKDSKIFKYMSSSKPPEDVSSSKVFKYEYESPSKSSEDLSSFKVPRLSKQYYNGTGGKHEYVIPSKLPEDLSISKVSKLSRQKYYGGLDKHEYVSPSKSSEDLRFPKVPRLSKHSGLDKHEYVSPSKSSEDLSFPKVSRLSRQYYGLDKHEYESSEDLSFPKVSRLSRQYYGGTGLDKHEYESSEDLSFPKVPRLSKHSGLDKHVIPSKSSENLKFSKVSRLSRQYYGGVGFDKHEFAKSSEDLSKVSRISRHYNTGHSNLGHQHSLRNVKSLHVLTN